MLLLTVKEAKKLTYACVYALCDVGGQPFYVGRTIRPWRRFAEHCWKSRRGHSNPAVVQRIAELGSDLRVLILQENPTNLNESERLEIAARPWLLNAIGPHHWSWKYRSDKPWAAGAGIFCPTTYVLSKMKDPQKKATVRSYLRELSLPERCRVEIETFQEFSYFERARMRKDWLPLAYPKMLRCLEDART